MSNTLTRRSLLKAAVAGAANFSLTASAFTSQPPPSHPLFKEPVAQRIARWVNNLSYEELPDEVINTAKKCLLDQIGCQLVGATLPHTQPVLSHVRELGGRPESMIVFHGDKTSPVYAAYANGTFGHSFEYDDSHLLAGHPGVCVIPSALALAEHHHKSGKALILAIVAGYQAMTLSGAAIHNSSRKLGWHGTKVQGVFGSAAGSAKILGLDQAKIANALAIAGSEASGPMEYDQSGGEVKRLHAGSASRSGAQAALLAQKGLTGPVTIFEGKRGIYHLFGDGFDNDPEFYWKRDFHIRDTMFKLIPAVFTTHGAIQAAQRLKEQYNIDYREITKIEAGISELTRLHGAGITYPEDMIGAQFSLAYSLGLCFVRGHNRLSDYQDPATWKDPEILAIAGNVTTWIDPTFIGNSVLGGEIKVYLKDGRELSARQVMPRGHHENPASFEDVLDKFSALIDGYISKDQAEQIIDQVSSLDSLQDCATLTHLLVNN